MHLDHETDAHAPDLGASAGVGACAILRATIRRLGLEARDLGALDQLITDLPAIEGQS